MNFVLAISGGIDSMVLLDIFNYTNRGKFVVAHFDHGMRPSSKADAEFVRRRAKDYGVKFYLGEGHLSPDASEAEAREARYKFLHEVAKKEGNALIVTAHHINDLAETVAINILRGTGWRGLAPFYGKKQRIARPFIHTDQPLAKYDIYMAASMAELPFRQDPTNCEDKYLRNRLRKPIFDAFFTDDYFKLIELYAKQIGLRGKIEDLAASLLPEDGHYKRSWFSDIDDDVAIEILRAGLMRKDISLTRPQLLDFLKAIREYAPEKKFNLPGDKLVVMHKDFFVL